MPVAVVIRTWGTAMLLDNHGAHFFLQPLFERGPDAIEDRGGMR